MDPLATRKVGRTTLALYPLEGISHLRWGQWGTCAPETTYAVVACATKGRPSVTLMQGTYNQAERYLSSYSPSFGLVTKG